MKPNISKITLGTAQLGLNYGIANVNGIPDFNYAINILNNAYQNGINTFDTSPLYGNSEEIIGSFISSEATKELKCIKIVSKLPQIKLNDEILFDNLYTHIKKQIIKSLKNLKIKKIPIYLLHHAPDIFLKDGLVIKCLNQIKKDGLIDKFGISAYEPEEVEESLKFKEVDIIQVPVNIFDNRMIKAGLLKKLKKRNYLIFARSIYLQGLFFIAPNKLPKYLEIGKEHLLKLNKITSELNMKIAEIAFLYVRDLPEITSIIIGIENIEQLTGNINLLNKKSLPDDIYHRLFEEFSDLPKKLLNPSLWNTGF